jgi:hypothetical protein
MKFRGLLGNILKIYTTINWKFYKKWINFYTHTTYQNEPKRYKPLRSIISNESEAAI